MGEHARTQTPTPTPRQSLLVILPQVLLNNMAPLRSGQSATPAAGLGIGRGRPRELRPGENIDVVVEHVLQELDWHYLAVRGPV